MVQRPALQQCPMFDSRAVFRPLSSSFAQGRFSSLEFLFCSRAIFVPWVPLLLKGFFVPWVLLCVLGPFPSRVLGPFPSRVLGPFPSRVLCLFPSLIVDTNANMFAAALGYRLPWFNGKCWTLVFSCLHFQGLGKLRNHVSVTQNVFGNNSRKTDWRFLLFLYRVFAMLPRLLLWLLKWVQTCSRKHWGSAMGTRAQKTPCLCRKIPKTHDWRKHHFQNCSDPYSARDGI